MGINSTGLWDETPIDISDIANNIWGIANRLRGVYMPDKYGDVIIPMTIIRRFECVLEDTKNDVVEMFEKNPTYPEKAMCKLSGYQFYNTSRFDLTELCNDADHIAENFKAYIEGFSKNIVDILTQLTIFEQIKKMDENGCLYSVIEAFSDIDLYIDTCDSVKMGYVLENLIGRFYQNVDAGQYYTGRDIIKLCVSLLISEGSDDIFDDSKIITVCDQACGTGGMLSTAYTYLKHYNPTADVRLFGQEYMGPSYAVGLAEMLIKGQNAENFKHADTFKQDCFKDVKMRYVLENPPFGTPWAGDEAKEGQEEAVRREHEKGFSGRWGAGLPGGGDSQLLFVQSAINKLDDKLGRAAIIENGSPLFTGGTASGESQIRRWLLENDLIEAIIQLPTDLFYNTGISTYIWLISKNKRDVRKGFVQLIDASSICHKLRKPLGNKKKEFTAEDRSVITKLYNDFTEGEHVKIYKNTEFMYREYSVMQPLQRSYSITDESIERMLQKGSLNSLWDEAAVYALENPVVKEEKVSKNKKKKTEEEIAKEKEKKQAKKQKDLEKLDKYRENKPIYDRILDVLNDNKSDKKWLSPNEFIPYLTSLLSGVTEASKLVAKIADGLSIMDKTAVIQRDKKGNIIYDTESKDTEIVKWDESIDDYMAREVLPHVPDAKWFFEGKDENADFESDMGEKTVKIGAEIPFTRYFYKHQQPTPSEELEKQFLELDASINERIKNLFGGM